MRKEVNMSADGQTERIIDMFSDGEIITIDDLTYFFNSLGWSEEKCIEGILNQRPDFPNYFHTHNNSRIWKFHVLGEGKFRVEMCKLTGRGGPDRCLQKDIWGGNTSYQVSSV